MKMQIRFYLKKNSHLHLIKMQIHFYLKKNSDLHLMKMPIHFYFEKFRSTSKEDVDPILFEEN